MKRNGLTYIIVLRVKDEAEVVSQRIISWFKVSVGIIYVEHFTI